MASSDSSDSDICYLPPSESSGAAREPRYQNWEKKPTVSTSRDDGDSLRRSSHRNNNDGDRRRYRSGSRDFKREKRSRTTSSSPGRGKERRSRSRRSRSSSRERRKSTKQSGRESKDSGSSSRERRKSMKHSGRERKDSGSSSRERQRKYMRYARRSRSSSRSNSKEKQRSHSLQRSSRSRRSRSSSSERREGYMNYDRRSRSRSRSSSRDRRERIRNYDRRSRSRSKLSSRDRRERNIKYARQSRSSSERESPERKERYDYGHLKSRSVSRESRRDDQDGYREESKAAINASKTQRKGEKKTFYCPLCLIELNSEDTMNSHVNGVKHTKKVIEYNQKVEKEAMRGRILPEMVVYQIPNPEATKKKVPIRLHEKIKVSADPVVGLDFIQEFIAESDSEMEPYYECQLCGCQGHANMIFGHIMGSKHRQKFAEEVYEKEIKNGQMKYLNMNQKQLLDFARRKQENNDQISRRIRTELSDEKYPWPPGKAPWSIEKGGNGKAPKNVRNWSKNGERKEDSDTKRFIPEDVKVKPEIRMNDEPRSSLPPPNKIGPPKSSEDVQKYIDLGSQMIKMAIECNDAMEESDKMKLKDALGSMASEMRQAAERRENNNV